MAQRSSRRGIGVFIKPGGRASSGQCEPSNMRLAIVLDETTSEVVWPLSPGNYVARLMKDDGYDSLAASAAFVIR